MRYEAEEEMSDFDFFLKSLFTWLCYRKHRKQEAVPSGSSEKNKRKRNSLQQQGIVYQGGRDLIIDYYFFYVLL